MGTDKHNSIVTVSKRASEEIGTSGHLMEGHTFSVWDLLHALMLPSGNDAAIALAEHFGDYLLNKKSKNVETPLTNKRVIQGSVKPECEMREKQIKSSIFPEINKYSKSAISDYSFSETNSSAMYSSKTEKSKSFSLDSDIRSMSCYENFHANKNYGMFSDSPKISRFIKEMNKNAQKIGMTNTHFDSPHGLANKNNMSTAYDIAMLCSV